MDKIYRKLGFALVLIGAIGLTINYLFGQTIHILTMEQIQGTNVYWYRLNTRKYILNIINTFQDTSRLSLDTPPQTWIHSNSTNWATALGNNLLLIVNYIIFGLNVIMYPFRWAFYVLKGILSIVGVQTVNTENSSGLLWLVRLINFFVEIQIPYFQ